MARIEDLAEHYGRHIATPWQRTVAGAQRIIMVVYDKELERTLRARTLAFETATREAGHDWRETDLADVFAEWMASDDYRDEYFASPEDLHLKLEAEFPAFVAERLRHVLRHEGSVGKHRRGCPRRGLTLRFRPHFQSPEHGGTRHQRAPPRFFPGNFEHNNYRLLDARDGWNYLAVPITLHGEGGLL